MFLLVPAYPGCPGSKAAKRSWLLLYHIRPGKGAGLFKQANNIYIAPKSIIESRAHYASNPFYNIQSGNEAGLFSMGEIERE